jgi:Cu(I)/Ag(I) efflux system membrane fusion protein
MNKGAYSIVILAGITAAYAGAFWYTQRATASAEALNGRKVLHYVDPMHPAYTSPEPGIAPDCGMALEPVYANGGDGPLEAQATASHQHHTALQVSARQRALMNVQVEPVQRTTAARSVRVFGRVAAEENRIYKVNIGVPGYIRHVSPVTTGSHVEKNQWLATFSSPDARQPIQAYLVSLDVVDRAEKTREPASQANIAVAGLNQNIDRLLTMGMSAVQVEEIRQKRLVPPNIMIAAPGSGFVLARNVSAGEKVEADTELYQIADLEKVWIYADAFGVDTGLLRSVAEAEIWIPGQLAAITARVGNVLPVFDPATQSLKLRLEADNADFLLRPDMIVDVDLKVKTPPAITVPRDAVVQTGRGSIVFVERAEGQFEPRRVQAGWRSGDRAEILRGLEPGERVAVSGTFLLDSDRRLRMGAAEMGAEQ